MGESYVFPVTKEEALANLRQAREAVDRLERAERKAKRQAEAAERHRQWVKARTLMVIRDEPTDKVRRVCWCGAAVFGIVLKGGGELLCCDAGHEHVTNFHLESAEPRRARCLSSR